MAARAELAAPCRLLPAAGAALRLQLSVQPGADGRRRFRLGLRLPEAGGGAVRGRGGGWGGARGVAPGLGGWEGRGTGRSRSRGSGGVLGGATPGVVPSGGARGGPGVWGTPGGLGGTGSS